MSDVSLISDICEPGETAHIEILKVGRPINGKLFRNGELLSLKFVISPYPKYARYGKTSLRG